MTTNANSNTINDVEIKNASESGDSVPEVGDLDDGIGNTYHRTIGKETVATATSASCNATATINEQCSVDNATAFGDAPTLNKLMASPQKFGCNTSGGAGNLQATLPNILRGEEPITDDRADEMMKFSPNKLSLLNNHHHNNIKNGYLAETSN